ncbi:hypothetical protein [Sphingobacterium lactis]|uniref:hypothetical protein n=1 Tax=Sphingobacterium lactis TaxID=797291 RepID=UPI00135C1B2B|nr:hypothetical protein [Sphingobacterium lactis]
MHPDISSAMLIQQNQEIQFLTAINIFLIVLCLILFLALLIFIMNTGSNKSCRENGAV